MFIKLRVCRCDKQLLPFEITLYRTLCLSNPSVYPSQYRFFLIISHLNILFLLLLNMFKTHFMFWYEKTSLNHLETCKEWD